MTDSENPTPEGASEADEPADDIQVLPLVALRGTVIFPEMIVPLEVGRDRSVKALERAVRANSPVALIAQRDSEAEEINAVDELHSVGTLAKIAQLIRLQNGTIRAIVQGQKRIRMLDLVQLDPYLEARIQLIPDEKTASVEIEALMAAGSYRPLVSRVVDFADVPAAITDLAERRTWGRVVVRI